jgi:hypothetical protein
MNSIITALYIVRFTNGKWGGEREKLGTPSFLSSPPNRSAQGQALKGEERELDSLPAQYTSVRLRRPEYDFAKAE